MATYPYKVGRVARTLEPFVKNGLEGDEEFKGTIAPAFRAATPFPGLLGALCGTASRLEQVVPGMYAWVDDLVSARRMG